jgi:uncharacterized protein with PQ loop repeat
MNLPVVAGAISTSLFAISMLPMLVKASRTKNLSSYSLGNIVTSNVANVIHSVYVFSLPFGPIWLLHSFYLVSTALMLVWYLRFRHHPLAASQGQGVRTLTSARATVAEQKAAA